MKHFVILLFLGLIQTLSAGQTNDKVKSGNLYSVSLKTIQPTKIIGSDEKGFYVEARNLDIMSHVYLEHYDVNLNQVISTRLKFLKDKENRTYEYVFYANKKIYVFSSFRDYKGHKRMLDVQTVNKETMELNNDLQRVKEIDDFPYLYAKFEFRTSPDGSKLLIYSDYPVDNKDKKSDRYIFDVFEGDIKKVWSKEIKLPYEEDLFTIQSYHVDNDGRLLFLGALFEGKTSELVDKDITGFGVYSFKQLVKNAESKNLSFKYILITYDGKETPSSEFEISLKGKFICDLNLTFDKTGDLICTGFYSKVGIKSIRGVFYLRYDGTSKAIEKEETKDFSMDFMTYGFNEWKMKEVEKQKQEGGDIEMYQYDLRHTVTMNDGSIYLFAEQDMHVGGSRAGYTSYGPTIGANGLGWGYNGLTSALLVNIVSRYDILIVKIDPDGEVKLIDRIVKRQKTLDFYCSFGVASDGEDVYLIYNDHASNYDPDSKNKPYQYSENISNQAVLVIAKITKDGKIQAKPVASTKEVKSIFKPKNCIQFPGNRILVNSDNGYKQRFNTVLLE